MTQKSVCGRTGRPHRAGFQVLSLAALLLGAGAVGAGQSPGRYTDPEYHYSLEIPAGWTEKQQPRPMVAFLGPTEQGFRVNISIYSEPVSGMTLGQYLKASRENLAKVQGWQVRGAKKTLLGGEPAEKLRSHLGLKGRPPIENSQILCVHNKRGYVVTFTALPINHQKYEPVFEKALASFRW